MYVTQFTVTGQGRFPLDMLRYDACYPDTQEDASKLAEAIGFSREQHSVGLRMVGGNKQLAQPTEGRWQSFGWSVSNIRTQRV